MNRLNYNIRIFETGVIDIHPNGLRHYPKEVGEKIHALKKEGFGHPQELVLYRYGDGLDFNDVWIRVEGRRA